MLINDSDRSYVYSLFSNKPFSIFIDVKKIFLE